MAYDACYTLSQAVEKVKPDWNLSGAVEDLDLLFSVGYRVANAPKCPTWSAGSEFSAKRRQMLRQAGSAD